MTESDTDLVVEYEEQPGGTTSHTEGEDSTASDSNTVNQEQDQDQDQDSFSILEGDSLLDGEGPQPDMPPLFVHVTCTINMKSCHGSTPIQTLPTCLSECWQSPSLDLNSHLLVSFQFSNCCFGFSLCFPAAGEIISCLENFEELQSVDLNELSVTLDIYVLTLSPEIEVMADFHHNRSVKIHVGNVLLSERVLKLWRIHR